VRHIPTVVVRPESVIGVVPSRPSRITVNRKITLEAAFVIDPVQLEYDDWITHYDIGVKTTDNYKRWVAGLHPLTDGQFTVNIEMRSGKPYITWNPDLKLLRHYIPEGKIDLREEWEDADYDRHFFFRVRVEELSKQ